MVLDAQSARSGNWSDGDGGSSMLSMVEDLSSSEESEEDYEEPESPFDRLPLFSEDGCMGNGLFGEGLVEPMTKRRRKR